MTGYTKLSTQLDNGQTIMNEIVDDLKGGGGARSGQPNWFIQIGNTLDNSATHRILLESTSAVDPVQIDVTTPSTQEYRLLFVGTKISGVITEAKLYWGTKLQIPDVNNVHSDTPYIKLWDLSSYPKIGRNRFIYRITIVPRGFAFFMHPLKSVNELDKGCSFLCIQRPVNPQSGLIRSTGLVPVFSLGMSTCNPSSDIYQTVVREQDVNAASPMRSVNQPGYHSMYRHHFGWNHPNILSNLTHVIKVPFGLATDRHMYMEEMDLISFVHAGSFIHGQNIQVDTYTGSDSAGVRTYSGGFGIVDYNYVSAGSSMPDRVLSGSRIMLLTKAPGNGNANDITDGNA